MWVPPSIIAADGVPLDADWAAGCAVGGSPFCSALAKLPSRFCQAEAARVLPASDGAAELGGSPPASTSDSLLADPFWAAAGAAEESDDLSSSSFSCVSRERGFLPAGTALACCSVGPKASPSWSGGLGGDGTSPCAQSEPEPAVPSRCGPRKRRLPLPLCWPLPLHAQK